MKQELLGAYVAPEVTDYGSLVEMTSAAHLVMGVVHTSDLSFSSPNTPGSPGSVGGVSNSSPGPTLLNDVADGGGSPGGGSPGGGTTSGGGSTGGGSSGGGQLPFTGFAAGVLAAVGSAFAAGGTFLRRASRTRRQP